ncbi:MAG: FMN-binding protein [Frankiaceae bacterium]|nr:FMN-binding protein [Frankiaceae bacterium]MBV9869564.1 FMN-binding protein [Frankiaceae bacterium]
MRRVVLAVVSTAASLVLLLSFKSHGSTATATPPAAVSTATTSSGSSAGDSATSSAGSATSTRRKTTTSSTVTGTAANTRYGPVEVRITVSNGKLTRVNAVEYPTSDPRDAQINAYAIPALSQEALAAGSANIDLISGATYTSYGYISSLQSALDKAGI